jgi:hypothetical protein
MRTIAGWWHTKREWTLFDMCKPLRPVVWEAPSPDSEPRLAALQRQKFALALEARWRLPVDGFAL